MSPIEHIKQIRDILGIGLAESKKLLEQFGTPEKAIEGWYEQQEENRLAEEAREFDDPKSWKNHWVWGFKPIEEEDLEHLKMLSENYCKRLWNEWVSEDADSLVNRAKNRIIRMDDEKNWKIRNFRFVTEVGSGYNWEEDCENHEFRGLGDFLNHYLDWKPEDSVCFFYSRNAGYKTTWELFMKYCKPLLHWSYDNVLINLNDSKVVIFFGTRVYSDWRTEFR